MYVTRPLSLYKDSSASASEEGPNTGVLVMEDEGLEKRWFCGLVKDNSVKVLPFPQNKILELCYVRGRYANTHCFDAMLIPVINQLPSNSNQYYIIDSSRLTAGLVYTSSKEEDICSCCCDDIIEDIRPQLFDPRNVYQQFQINYYTESLHDFKAKSMAPDGIPPYFLRQVWRAHTKTLKNFKATPALGVNAALRARFPKLDSAANPVVVGKWYCPFIFIREGEIGAQMRDSAYYEMTLQQNWEEIYGCYNDNNSDNDGHVAVDVSVGRETVLVGGVSLATKRVAVSDGVMWFGATSELGLNMAIVERVKWEEERVGFVWGKNNEDKEIERVVRREEFKGKGMWKRFRCYVLVERFVLKRMNGTLVLTWQFRHTHQVRTKWE